MKKRAVKVLLPLLFSCFFVFSGFLNVNAYALTASFPQFNLGVTRLYCPELENWFTAGDDDIYSFVNNWNTSINSLSLRLFASSDESDAYFTFPLIDGYDYYLYTSLGYIKSSGSSFIPSDFEILNRNDNSILSITDKQSFKFIYDDEFATTAVERYAFVGKLNISDVNSFGSIRFTGNQGILLNRLFFECSVFLVPSDSGNGVNDVVTAINNQTTTLGGKLDSIEHSIKDQYSGDPETEFSVDDVITQHNEKMGVLSFGSDVMLQFLDMFQSANIGTAQLTLPGFNITVENVEYSVWPDYSFNFEQLNEWVPGLMSVIRLMLPAFVWLMVLRYCINVFEKNFLSNGG